MQYQYQLLLIYNPSNSIKSNLIILEKSIRPHFSIQRFLHFKINFITLVIFIMVQSCNLSPSKTAIQFQSDSSQIIIEPVLIQQMSKIINREITSIISNYLYNHPLKQLKMDEADTNPKQLKTYKNVTKPLDLYLRMYFNTHKYIGSTERSNISDKVYNLIRYQYLLSYLIKSKPFEFEKDYHFNEQMEKEIEYKINMLFSSDFYNAIDNQSLPKFLRASQNKLLFKQLSMSLMKEDFLYDQSIMYDKKKRYQIGDENAAFDVSYIMNSRAPLTLRVNPLKTTKHELIEKLEKKLKLRLQKCQYAPFGLKIVAPKNINLLDTEQFERGFFEIQDQGSQIAALRADVKPGDLILDYCGGSGGKSLALAHLLEGKGQIFVHEPRQVALGKAKKRFSRAGINNVQFHNNEQSLNKIMLGKIDWLIVDAPCTGTGTLRRNPDIKLKFHQNSIKNNVILQQQIVSKSLKFLKPTGRLLYITCSLLKQQNELQIRQITKLHNMQVENGEIMKILPQKDGTDGFFATVLKRKR